MVVPVKPVHVHADAAAMGAAAAALTGPVTTACPASILRLRDSCALFLDRASADLLPGG